jgi:tRNA (guanine-N7-)-methyltransferase
MGKNKLERFAETALFSNFFQPSLQELTSNGFPLKGRWNEQFFHNSNPIVLELGCGKGEYTIALAERNPHRNLIGIDRKGARMWRGCKTSLEKKMTNVAFLRMQIANIEQYFAQGEVNEIWITFPDPQPRASKAKKRLTSPCFLDYYRKTMSANGIIHLKTDSQLLYLYTLEVVQEERLVILGHHSDIYDQLVIDPDLQIQTFYEKMWLEQGRTIRYVCFTVNPVG